MARQDQVEDDGDKCGDGNRGSTKDGADPCGESSASKCAGRALNARAKGDRQTHERGIALRQAVAGKHDHAVHADDDLAGDSLRAASEGERPSLPDIVAEDAPEAGFYE